MGWHGLWKVLSQRHYDPRHDGNGSIPAGWRASGSTGENPFSDVSMDRYFGKAVLWASQNQLVLGRGNGIFDPDGTISRQDMVTVFYRYAKLMEYRTDATGDLGKFPDSGRVSGYAKNAMAWAVGAGLINGMTSGNACILSAHRKLHQSSGRNRIPTVCRTSSIVIKSKHKGLLQAEARTGSTGDCSSEFWPATFAAGPISYEKRQLWTGFLPFFLR